MRRRLTHHAFTLVELLVVVAIIALLIGILLPSLNGARISARNSNIKLQLKSLGDGLEMFNNDVGEYPDSSKRYDETRRSGQSAPAGVNLDDSVLYGAQSLVLGLMGRDLKGYVTPRRARKYRAVDNNPAWWYDDVLTPGSEYYSEFPRELLYFSENADRVVKTMDVIGGRRPPEMTANPNLFNTYLMIDDFDRPILYYRANPKGRNKVLCDGAADSDGFAVTGGPVPYYNLLDNELFTGNDRPNGTPGWRFGTMPHALGFLGDPDEPDDLSGNTNAGGEKATFSSYIHDHRIGHIEGAASGENHQGNARPMNTDTYMLISAGHDGMYGTNDDIKNFDRE